MATQPMPVEETDDDTMPDSELVSILAGHEASAIGYQGADTDITSEQETALAYYNGKMDDVPAQDGCSSVVDGTVALVVDNALSAILKPFVSSDETVRFAPRGPEDIEVADQATEYVNYVFNCDNPGFLILHNWFKDALLSKLGVIKVWWEPKQTLEAQQIELQDDLHAQFVRSHDNYLGEQDGVAHVGQQIDDGKVCIECIPPEEFRITPGTRSIEDAVYTAHVPTNYTRSDLIELGFDPELVEGLPAFGTSIQDSTLAQTRYEDEDYTGNVISALHKPNDRLALRDEYVRIDYDGDGVAELRRVLRVDDVILLNEEVDDNPFATLCPIPMPHKVFGHSLADRVIQEQKIGTVVWRQTLDNLYKSKNPRPVVGEGAERSDGSTGESLMDNAPGAGVFAKDVNQLGWLEVPFTADKTYSMLELLDKKVEENSGVSRAGQGLDTNALRKSGQTTATEMALIAEGKNARTEMVARIFAETGVSRMFKLILLLVSKYQPKSRVIRLRNKWVEVDPRGWPEMDVSISVGLGIGDKAEQVAQASTVLQTMEQIAQTPFAALIDAEKVYNALKRLFTAVGIKNTDEYLNEPEAVQQQPEKPDPEMQKVQAQVQLQQAKLQGDQQLAAANLQQQQQEAALKQELARQQAEFEANLAVERMNREHELALQKMALEAELDQQRMALEQQMAEHKQALAEKAADAKISTNRPGGELDK
jgi:hypothetical protein